MAIKVLLADDHRLLREGLRELLSRESDIEVVAEAENGRDAARRARDLAPDVIIMDVTMPELNGIEAARQIRSQRPEVRIVALSIHSDRRFVTQMFAAGASGYLPKDCAFTELVRAIREVAAGRMYLSPVIHQGPIDEYLGRSPAADRSLLEVLTPREREVLQLLAEGRSTKDAAARLHVSIKTIETHRQHIMEKLGIHSIAELTKYAIREGLTSLDA